MTAILLTGSRMGFLMMSISLFFSIIFNYRKLFNYKFIVLFLAISIVPLIMYKNIVAFKNIVQPRIDTFSSFLETGNLESLSKVRFALLKSRWEMFLDNPYLGVGLYNFEYESLKYYPPDIKWTLWNHNAYMGLLSEVGLLGFISYISLLFYVGYNLYYFRLKDRKYIYLFISFLTVCIKMLFLSYLTNRYLWALFIPLSMYLDAKKRKRVDQM